MKRRPDYKNIITKTERLSKGTTEKLERSKEINGNGKRSYEEAIWQEKMKSTRTEGRWQHMVGG